MSSSLLTLTPTLARRLAISRQRLAGTLPPSSPDALLDIVRDLGCLQLDPTSAVARSHLLVLWSRAGHYDRTHLDTLLWQRRSLFEYWAHAASIVLTEDFPLHYDMMQHWRQDAGGTVWRARIHDWMNANAGLRDHILEELARRGPLSSKDFEDRSQAAWHSMGWTSGRNISRMLDFLWTQGQILVKERRGNTRYWDLADRCLPDWTPRDDLPQPEVVRRAAQRAIRALGVAREAHIKQHFTRGRYPGLPTALKSLEAEGRLQRVQIAAGAKPWPGVWYIHTDDLPLLERLKAGDWSPRTSLLSPFDNLIADRTRTRQLFDFDFTIEIYVPKNKRRFGYFVLPILHGDRLIGRIDPMMDRKLNILRINAVYAEPDSAQDGAPAPAVAAAVRDLAGFLGARDIVFGDRLPDAWRRTLIE